MVVGSHQGVPGSSPGARTIISSSPFVVYMFCSLDIFTNIPEYAISCSETILSQYVRIVDICLVLGYLVFLAQNVVSQCSDVFCILDITRTILIDVEWVLNRADNFCEN